ncbi:MAG: hypothetical protein QM817_01405 [Archangium sp.]
MSRFGAVLLLSLSASACVGVRATPNAAVTRPAQLTVRSKPSKTPLAMTQRPCPQPVKLKSAPQCFKPLDVTHPALRRASKTTCSFATTAQFVGVRPALSVLFNVIEGQTGFSIRYLLEGDGSTHVLPEALTNPVWSGDTVVGLASDGKQMGFWKNDVCEVPPEGQLTDLEPLSDGRFVALWQLDDRTVHVIERGVDGAWSSFGPTLQIYVERLVSQNGRVSLMFDSTTSAVQRDFGTEHPDVARTRVLGRLTEQPKYTEFIPPHAWVPLPAADGATFSNAVAVADGSLGGAPSLFLPRGDGAEQVLLPELAAKKEASGECGETQSAWFAVSQAGVTSWTPGVLLARLEGRGTCSSRLIEPPPRNCPPGAPCAPPPQPYRQISRTEREVSLVLFNVGDRSGRLLELKLPARDERDVGRIAGVAVAVTDTEVLISAQGYFLVFDRLDLERRAK